MNEQKIEVKGHSYSSEFQILEKDLLFFKRVHSRKKVATEVDAFPNMWSFGFGEIHLNQVSVYRKGQILKADGPWAIFIPPFSSVKWRIMPGTFIWSAYLSTAKLPEFISHHPMAFPWQPMNTPQSVDEILNIVKEATDTIDISNEALYNPIALRAKRVIDQSFMNPDFSILQVARSVGVTHSFLSRSFKKCYGTTPIAYRNRMRVFESSKLMLFENHNVTSAGHEVGFLDSARFHKQFRTEMNATPSEFCLKKKQKRRLAHEKKNNEASQ